MCGIVGFTTSGLGAKQQEYVLNKMLTRINYRGPDETGLYIQPDCAMGNVRLSIVDLSSGQQPLCNQDGTMWIAYNGEVYNHIELREQLIKKGHQFRTSCDTEVVLHMYEEYGPDCLSQLNGQFAFSIWNEKTQSLFIARDRFGIRPLFYHQVSNQLIYASEIKCLFEHPQVDRQVNFEGLKESLIFWAPLSPNTFFDGVKELPPGHYMMFDKGQCTVHPYWKHQYTGKKFAGTIQEAAEELYGLLKSSVDLRLRADVQVAAYLSGGLDSSVTTALVKEVQPNVLNTFSIGFDEQAYDESGYQNEVAAFFNTNHKSISCNNSDIAKWLTKAVYHAEAPLLRTSPIPMMLLSSLVRENNIKVVLTGEGADEMLGGYNIFKETIIRNFWARQPQSKYRPLLLKKLYPYIPQLATASPMVLKMFFGYQLEQTNSPIYSHMLRWRNGQQLANLLSEGISSELNGYDPVANLAEELAGETSGYSLLEKAQLIESRLFMSGYLLSSQGDRVAMANSVEGRYPFLDHRVAEFCASLPDHYKLNGLNEKVLLKVMMKDQLPQSVIKRPKQAYRAPVAQSLLNDKALLDEFISPYALKDSGLFNPKKIEALLTKLKRSNSVSEQDNMALIGVLSSQILHKLFISAYQEIDERNLLKGDIKNKQIVIR
ncbi:asparagine synthase (glutamine-hydrolyzing) [Carboxylicivirga mesophila]|uniref:asparagine synthase (glutamine-hydrolyzing) n=1 Tax=Carboxylicivirga mesophila TaxID=1166478 RepID=A0ABS5K931_9BACT|nr:asparagine synthase (glutamine-hydrolyzing) [Carboxylicivirga mesophila]MBS2211509.1 asparagine synthase (glutamine-hydrolyzing) [Carboxylicivirga mesophila]